VREQAAEKDDYHAREKGRGKHCSMYVRKKNPPHTNQNTPPPAPENPPPPTGEDVNIIVRNGRSREKKEN